MGDLNDELIKRITEKGERVLHLHWDSGGPGAGADCEDIYKFDNVYWCRSSSDGFSGPYQSLDEAMDGFIAVTSATELISCSELTAAQLAERLEVFYDEDAEPEQLIVKINGEYWQISEDGKLMRQGSLPLKPEDPNQLGLPLA